MAGYAAAHGFGGLDWLGVIPGTIGGAAVMNSGYHASMDVCVVSVDTWNYKTDICRELTHSDLDYGFRSSRLQREPWIVLTVRLSCFAAAREIIRGIMARYRKEKAATQPLRERSAGSVWRDNVFMFDLVERLEFRRFGGAEISEKNPNFIVARDGCTASDVWELIRHIRRAAGEEKELEITLIGEFPDG